MPLIRLTGGRLCDPAAGFSGGVARDLYILNGRIATPRHVNERLNWETIADRTLDCHDHVIMAGGIDLHTHIGGGKVTLARMLMPESSRHAFLPSTRAAGDAYLRMGYTVAVEPAMLACNARQAHAEMADTPHLDTAAYVLLGNDRVLLELIAEGAPQAKINDYVAFMVTATQAIGVKVVNAGGIDAFKFNARKLDVDTPHPRYGVTPGQIIRRLAEAVHAIGLTHPLHVHCSNLGVPGNIASTLATIRAADGFPIHLAHAQFHCYGGGDGKPFASAAAELVAALREHPNVTIDVGQVMFGQTITISGDTMHQYANFRFARPRKSALVDIECEAGCGAVPFRYRDRQFVHSLQWAIGLELFLMVDDPSRVFLTTDHPNGGPFTSYPHLIRLLSDRSFRQTALAEIEPQAAAASNLSGIDREYSLDEIAVMTRSAPARLLGLRDQGTLADNAVGDVAVYRENSDRQAMFATPRWVVRRGKVFEFDPAATGWVASPSGESHGERESAADDATPKRTHTVRPDWDRGSLSDFIIRHDRIASYSLANLSISDDEMASCLGSEIVVHPLRGARST
jgi:formylmethanofuran dehydrogenase subunit A